MRKPHTNTGGWGEEKQKGRKRKTKEKQKKKRQKVMEEREREKNIKVFTLRKRLQTFAGVVLTEMMLLAISIFQKCCCSL